MTQDPPDLASGFRSTLTGSLWVDSCADWYEEREQLVRRIAVLEGQESPTDKLAAAQLLIADALRDLTA